MTQYRYKKVLFKQVLVSCLLAQPIFISLDAPQGVLMSLTARQGDAASSRYVAADSRWSWIVTCGNNVIGLTTIGFYRTFSVYFHSLIAEYEVGYTELVLILGLFSVGESLGGGFMNIMQARNSNQ